MADALRDLHRQPLREVHKQHYHPRLSSRQPHSQKYATRLETDKPKTAIMETTGADRADVFNTLPPRA